MFYSFAFGRACPLASLTVMFCGRNRWARESSNYSGSVASSWACAHRCMSISVPSSPELSPAWGVFGAHLHGLASRLDTWECDLALPLNPGRSWTAAGGTYCRPKPWLIVMVAATEPKLTSISASRRDLRRAKTALESSRVVVSYRKRRDKPSHRNMVERLRIAYDQQRHERYRLVGPILAGRHDSSKASTA